ncbi:MAG: hypothetical protein JXA99_01535 [Candidatus Lokiarchaeota archaeon]|nr:hypothetical protein [Candidatus Lokiarchaeota archaeon]
MSSEINQQDITKITKIILTNKQKIIREEDLQNLVDSSYEFNEVINIIYANLKEVGFELITTTFLDQKYYILTSDGKDDNITPSQYGIIAVLFALSKEIDENLKLNDIKDIFSQVWDSDVKYLIENDYLRKQSIDNLEIIKITPLGKALLKNIHKDLQLKNLIDIFKKE